ncbi:MAG: gliding motility-associated ABC transporter substrate-binding protein GldG [Bacteroidota bacterium]
MKKKIKRQNITQLLLGIIIIILVNLISSFKFERFDLTSEKRYSLSQATKELIKGLDDIVYVKVYLEGEFPAGFLRLRNAAKEMLDEFRAYSKSNIEYEFINPSESKDARTRNETYKQLTEQGLQPTTLQVNENNGRSQKIIFPGAIFSYKERELPLQLLIQNSEMSTHPEVILNNSIQVLEYEFSNTIRKLCSSYQPKIAFIEGHGELSDMEVRDITKALSEYYRVDRVRINGQVNSLKSYKAIIIAKPDSAFDEKDKFIIDQFIMNGGKVLWLVETVLANMDSLISSSTTLGIPNPINLEDQLFKYGVRINTNLIQDIQACSIPVNTAIIGNQPRWELVPWLYFPMIMPVIAHPIVNNLNAIKSEFANSIDTVRAGGIKKTILLTTSKYTHLLNAPVRISLKSINNMPDEKFFNKPFQPIAVLLEGEFQSVFKNRIPSKIMESQDIGFSENSPPNKMIVISDGDIIRNQIQQSTGRIYPLGFDRYTQQQFGNKDFILNVVDYLCDESGLISVRSKELKLRLLDNTKIVKKRFILQLTNVCLPVALVIIFGLVLMLLRKRKYGK